MRRAKQVWQAIDLLGSLREFAYESTRYQWDVTSPCTFFLDAEYADIRITRKEARQISATVRLRAAFSWKLETEQDDVGVYVVARRKAVIGNVGHARFVISVPNEIHVSLRLQQCRLSLEGFDGELELPRRGPPGRHDV